MWMSFECKKHSYVICYHCSLHTLAPKPQDWETHLAKIKNIHYAPPSLCTRSLLPSLILAFHALAPPSIPHKVSKFKQPSGSISQPCVHSVDTTPWNKEYWIKMGHPPSETQPARRDDQFLKEKAVDRSIPMAECLQHYVQRSASSINVWNEMNCRD